MYDADVVSEDNIRNYRDLEVWQRSMDLAVKVYELTRDFPADERFGLTSQLQRACVSVSSNIAEGWGRAQPREFARFLRIAHGSLVEAETQLILAVRLQYVSRESAAEAWQLSQRIGQMLTQLVRSVESRSNGSD